MLIKNFRIRNYKSFLDSGQVEFGSGFNIILGQNNSGKTALLEALCLNFTAKPHRSLQSLPTPRSPQNPKSSVDVSLSLSGEELKEIHVNGGYSRLYLPIQETLLVGDEKERENKSLELLHQLWQSDELILQLEFKGQGVPLPLRTPSYGGYEVDEDANGNILYAEFSGNNETHEFKFNNLTRSSKNEEFGCSVGLSLKARIYAFKAERMNISSHNFGSNAVLNTDASNLPEVLHVLQTKNPRRFKKLNDHLRRIFPTIFEISVRPIENNRQEIVVWTIDPNTEREDLAIELSESGTGIGQALAILYVVITSEYPRTIIVDEPNSFLHPTAVRRLVEILKEYEQHQYIVSTHSPEIISIASPTNIVMVSWLDSQSHISQIDLNNIKDIQIALNEIGSKISDLLGPERVLWVEGPTEEQCFDAIIKSLRVGSPTDIAVRAVRATGDFDNKKLPDTMIWHIYEKLSSASSVLPAQVAFEFDRETRTSTQIDDLERRSNGKISFLPRRTFENYLIHPKAIASLLSTLPTFLNSSVTGDEVKKWILENDSKYVVCEDIGCKPLEHEWFINVNGAELIQDIFQTLSDNKEEYKKTTHGKWITEWLLANEPESLDELSKFIMVLIGYE